MKINFHVVKIALLSFFIISSGLLVYFLMGSPFEDKADLSADHVDQCYTTAASQLDKPRKYEHVDLFEIDFDVAIQTCKSALELDPENRTLKYYYARALESEASFESLNESYEILGELSEGDYAPALLEIYYFSQFYPELKLSQKDGFAALQASSNLGLELAEIALYRELIDENSEFYDKVAAEEVLTNLRRSNNPYLINYSYEDAYTQLSQWEKCYISLNAHDLIMRPKSVFYNSQSILLNSYDDLSGLKLQDLSAHPQFVSDVVNEYCAPVSQLSPRNARDALIKMYLPYLLERDPVSVSRTIDFLNDNADKSDYGLMLTNVFSYYINTEGLFVESDYLFEFLVSELIELLNSTDKQDIAYGSLVLGDLENYVTISKSIKNKVEANLPGLFKEYPGLANEFLAQNERRRTPEFINTALTDIDKFLYACVLIHEVDIADGSISFNQNKINTYFNYYSPADRLQLISFCEKHLESSLPLNLLLKSQYFHREHYFVRSSEFANNFLDEVLSVQDDPMLDRHVNWHMAPYPGRQSIKNIINLTLLKLVAPYYDLTLDLEDIAFKTMLSPEMLSNPYAMLDFSMHYEAIERVSQFRDSSIVKLTQFAQLYLMDQLPALVSETFTSNAESCSELAKRSDGLSEFLSSSRHFNNLSSYAEVKKINSIDLKKRTISFDILFMDIATRMQNLLEPDQYGVHMKDCSFQLLTESGQPTPKTSSAGFNYNHGGTGLQYDFSETARDIPLYLKSALYFEDWIVTRQMRAKVHVDVPLASPSIEQSFENEMPLNLRFYPFVKGTIDVPLSITSSNNSTISFAFLEKYELPIADGFTSKVSAELADRAVRGNNINLNLKFELENEYFSQILKIIFPLSVLAMLSLTALPKQSPSSDSVQLGLASTITLAITAYQFVVNALLPELPYLTALDAFIYLMFVSSAAAVCSNIILHINFWNDRENFANIMITVMNLTSFLTFLGGFSWLIFAYMQVYA